VMRESERERVAIEESVRQSESWDSCRGSPKVPEA
jgi:hypothetical protein